MKQRYLLHFCKIHQKQNKRYLLHFCEISITLGLLFSSIQLWAEPLPDALGRKISSDNKAVVSLSPAITELLYSLDLEQKIIGVSDFSDYPKEAKDKPHVGAYTNPSLESIVALKPDLVIVPQEGPEDIRVQMDRLPLPYAVVNMRKIEDIPKTAVQLGSWMGDEKKGKAFREMWEQKVNRLFTHRKKTSLHILVEIQSEPLIAAGKDTFLDEIVDRCGGINVIKEKGYPHVSMESLVKKPIDVIFLADYFSKDKEKESARRRWKNFPSAEDAKIFVLDPDTVARPGPRLVEGIEKICTRIAEQNL